MAFFKKWFSEQNLFFLVLLIDCALVCSIPFYPTMDGPSHLYNATLLKNMLSGNAEIQQYFAVNSTPVPNWLSTAVLALLNSCLPAWCSEKLFIIGYIIGLSVSFRLLVKQLAPHHNGLSILIVPFAHSLLFQSGFYNYCCSFIFLFLLLYYWLKNQATPSIRFYIIVFCLLSLTYFSAILTYLLAGCMLGIFAIQFQLAKYYGNNSSILLKNILRRFGVLLLIALPTLLCSFLFFQSTHYIPSGEQYPLTTLAKWLTDIRCIIVFDYNGEKNITRMFLLLLGAITFTSIFTRFKQYQSVKKNLLEHTDILLLPIGLVFCLFLVVPDGWSAGMMSARFCLLFFLLLVVWIAAQKTPQPFTMVVIAFTTLIHLGLILKRHNGNIRKLNAKAETIYQSAKYIDTNSIVLPIYLADRWSETHFSNYLGIDKPLILLENYEASVGWFPIVWNTTQMPHIQLCGLDSISEMSWISNKAAHNIRQIEYVYVYGGIEHFTAENWPKLKKLTDENFNLLYTSPDNYVAIYRTKNTP